MGLHMGFIVYQTHRYQLTHGIINGFVFATWNRDDSAKYLEYLDSKTIKVKRHFTGVEKQLVMNNLFI